MRHVCGEYVLKVKATLRTAKGKLYKRQPDNCKKLRTLLKRQKIEWKEEFTTYNGDPAIRFTF
jgi:hypothetical protein